LQHSRSREADFGPPGAVGEIHIGGAGVARGHHNRPNLTAVRFVPDPFSKEPDARLYRTGDLARWLPNGQLEFLGHNDSQIKIRGYRIELGEIEACLAAYPAVREAAVTALEDSTGLISPCHVEFRIYRSTGRKLCHRPFR
jgi:acyl-coenzyme A synthetase/AMP-(fatty) acid ligase